jgi:hypothetical protein
MNPFRVGISSFMSQSSLRLDATTVESKSVTFPLFRRTGNTRVRPMSFHVFELSGQVEAVGEKATPLTEPSTGDMIQLEDCTGSMI